MHGMNERKTLSNWLAFVINSPHHDVEAQHTETSFMSARHADLLLAKCQQNVILNMLKGWRKRELQEKCTE